MRRIRPAGSDGCRGAATKRCFTATPWRRRPRKPGALSASCFAASRPAGRASLRDCSCWRWELGRNFDFEYHSAQLSIDTAPLTKGCSAMCTFVNDFAGEDVLKALAEEGVKLIALRRAGFDRVDLRAAKDAGITASLLPAYSPYAVGKHAVALMLSLPPEPAQVNGSRPVAKPNEIAPEV
ncbi:unnamed protein product [Symbiodinium natans]|uniref:D-isomer specific 2-hydroxyacid dehydrogenase catalytic domain-containing protein n=1 Tax=Symbiodinium natans TaxID=878477 RepID=A0A812SGA8_9DINO|nr:unnamed protein product [Symbiodinium natans]